MVAADMPRVSEKSEKSPVNYRLTVNDE